MEKSRGDLTLTESNYENLKYNLKAFIDEYNSYVSKIRKELTRGELSDEMHKHLMSLKEIDSFEDSKYAFHQIMHEIN